MAKKKSKGKQPSTNNEYWIKEELFEQSTGIKDKGKTYKEVRTKNTDYFMYLIKQPAGTVYNYFDFLKYCMEILSKD